MTPLGRIGWLGPAGLAALAAALVIAVIVARHPPSQSAAGRATPAAARPSPTPRVPFGADAVYGPGMSTVVDSPQPSLRPQLGDEWRELGRETGRVLVSPTGTPSSYFELSVAATARGRAGRLELLTSTEDRAIQPVGTGSAQVLNYGPLHAAPGRSTGVALMAVAQSGASPGPPLVLSPIQAVFLAPGEALMRMPALAEPGPGGVRGLFVPAGASASFPVTPGMRGPAALRLRGAANRTGIAITVSDGTETRSNAIPRGRSTTVLGTFAHPGGLLSLSVHAPAGHGAGVFIERLGFVPGRTGP